MEEQLLKNTVNITKNTVEYTKDKVSIVTSAVYNTFSNQVSDLFKFFFERNIIQTAVGLIIASQISNIAKVISDSIIKPLFDKFVLNKNKNFDQIQYKFLGIEFKLGNLILELIKLLMIILMMYLLWKGSQIQNFDFIKTTVEKLNPVKPRIAIVAQ